MFGCLSPDPALVVVPACHFGHMADLFAIVGVLTVSLLGVVRWWEEH
jgi:hypothetical protein